MWLAIRPGLAECNPTDTTQLWWLGCHSPVTFPVCTVRSPKVGNRFACSRILQIICRGDMGKKNKDVNDLYCQLVPRFVFLTITGLDWWCVHTAFGENMRPPDWATQQCKTSIQTCEYLSGTTLVGASGSMRASRTDSCHFHWSFQLDGMIKREGWNKQLMFSVCLLFQEMFVLHLFAVHPMQPDSLGDKTEENCPVPEFEDRLWACILGCRRHIMTRMIFSTLFCAHVGPPWALFFWPCFNNE